jgi:hypothetical protein
MPNAFTYEADDSVIPLDLPKGHFLWLEDQYACLLIRDDFRSSPSQASSFHSMKAYVKTILVGSLNL